MRIGKSLRLMAALAISALLASCQAIPHQAKSTDAPVTVTAMTLPAPTGREIPLNLYAPADGCAECPLVFFSHGAGLTNEAYRPLIDAWVAAGYVVAAPLHVDSAQHPMREEYSGFDWVRTRIADYEAISAHFLGDEFAARNITLSGHLIAAGHSFGALTSQIAGGARLDEAVGAMLTADAIAPDAILALSPPGPIPDYIDAEGWSHIAKPMLVVTGTEDFDAQMTPRWELHMVSFEAARQAPGYLLVFDGMDHYFDGAFGKNGGAPFTRSPQLQALNALSLRFMAASRTQDWPDSQEWHAIAGDGLRADAYFPGS